MLPPEYIVASLFAFGRARRDERERRRLITEVLAEPCCFVKKAWLVWTEHRRNATPWPRDVVQHVRPRITYVDRQTVVEAADESGLHGVVDGRAERTFLDYAEGVRRPRVPRNETVAIGRLTTCDQRKRCIIWSALRRVGGNVLVGAAVER